MKTIYLMLYLKFRRHQHSTSTIQSAEKINNLVDTLWIPLCSWTSIEFQYFRGHATMISTIFWKKPASSKVNVHFFCGIQKSFPRTRTTTNKPFLRPRQRSLAVKKDGQIQLSDLSLLIWNLHSRPQQNFLIQSILANHIELNRFFLSLLSRSVIECQIRFKVLGWIEEERVAQAR